MSSNLPSGTVTFLFTDIEGSTQLWERHPEAMKAALAKHDGVLRHIFENHNGYIFKTVGDAFCVAFASPSDALLASLAAQRALFNEAWGETPLKVRVGLHTGEAEERDGDYFGPPLNRAARLMSAGHGGQILLSIATQELVRDRLPERAALVDLGQHRLKDLFRPERIYQITAPGLPTEFPPLKTLDAKRNNLPAQPTSLVGREREVAAILNLLRREDVRLVTLTGPGGTGKTRLSLQAAADLIDEYEHGVYFINLSPVTEPDLVLQAVASVLGVQESATEPLADALHNYLRAKHLLLVLDNFEQVIPAAPQVGALMAAAPKLKLLATSREILRLRGEHDYPVPPLGLPQRGRKPTLAVLSQYESVALFIQRAKAARPDFEITDDNAPAIAEICTRLDGLPLAIELAAARSRMLTPQAMLEKLASRLKMLTGGARDLPARQQTLRGAIDWSYDLLDDQEKILFARLSVFRGGRSLEAIEAICGPGLELEVLEGIESLLNKSLLRQEESRYGDARFVMLETIHEYAREKLSESGEAEAIQRRHAEYFSNWAEWLHRDAPRLKRVQQHEVELNNISAALEWSLGGAEGEVGLRLIAMIYGFWQDRGHWLEWKRWMALVPRHLEHTSESMRARILEVQGALDFHVHRDVEAAKRHQREAVEILRRLGERRHLARTLISLSNKSTGIPAEYAEAIALAEEGITLAREEGDRVQIMRGFNVLGDTASSVGDFARAKIAHQQCLDLARELNNPIQEHLQYLNLGDMAKVEGDYEQAAALYRRSLLFYLELGDNVGALSVLTAMGGLIGQRGQPEHAARLMGASEALLEEMGVTIQLVEQILYDRDIAFVRGQLGDERFNALRAEGRKMTLDEAVELALAELRA